MTTETELFVQRVTDSICLFMQARYPTDRLDFSLPNVQMVSQEEFAKIRSAPKADRIIYYPNQNMVLDLRPGKDDLFCLKDDYNPQSALTFAERLFATRIRLWPAIIKVKQVPQSVAQILSDESADIRAAAANETVNNLVTSKIGIPNRLYRKWLNNPVNFPDGFYVSGALTLLGLEFQDFMKPIAIVGEVFDWLIAYHIVRPYLIEEFSKHFPNSQTAHQQTFKPITPHYFSEQEMRRILMGPEYLTLPIVKLGTQSPYQGQINFLPREEGWIKRVVRQLGFKLAAPEIDDTILQGYFLGGIGQAVLNQLQNPDGVLSVEEYSNAQSEIFPT